MKNSIQGSVPTLNDAHDLGRHMSHSTQMSAKRNSTYITLLPSVAPCTVSLLTLSHIDAIACNASLYV
jgi:hypothetical protein